MNFVEEFNQGQKGKNKGIHVTGDLEHISSILNGISRQKMYGVAGAPKSGKTTFVDYLFIIRVYISFISSLKTLEEIQKEVEFIYYSYEIDRVSKEFDFCAYFIYYEYGKDKIKLPEGVTKDGNNFCLLSSAYLRGELIDDEGKTILVSNSMRKAVKEVYNKHIVKLFGRYDQEGNQIEKGLITFIKERENPTGIYKYLKSHAANNGEVVTRKYGTEGKSKVVGYKPNNSKKLTLVIFDHIRKIHRERSFSLKESVDKLLEYFIEIRDDYKYSFVPIVHLNRNITDIQRLKQFGDVIFPTSDDVKDTGNLAEDANYLFTLFNPNDRKYNLSSHFGLELRDKFGNENYPNMVTLHLVESRHCPYPQHFRLKLEGHIKSFKKIIINQN